MSGIQWLTQKTPGKKRLFYFTSHEHLISNLENREIKVSAFSNCNDLFELASIDLANKEVRLKHKKWLEGTNTKVGLICFSEDWRNTLMWGYYTSIGSGVCLVFDVVVDFLHPVQYVSRRVPYNLEKDFPLPNEANFRPFSATKSSDWIHEREQRFFVDLSCNNGELESRGDLRFVKFGKSLELVGVINGPRPKFGKQQIVQVIQSSAEYIQCRPAFRDFKMVMQQSQRLWKP